MSIPKAEAGLERLSWVRDIVRHFEFIYKRTYAAVGGLLGTHTSSQRRLARRSVFEAVEALSDRARALHLVLTARQDFAPLAVIEVGGFSGTRYTAAVRQIHETFLAALDSLEGGDRSDGNRDGQRGDGGSDVRSAPGRGSTDPALLGDPQRFAERYQVFKDVVRLLERQLASIVSQAFSDCAVVGDVLKVWPVGRVPSCECV